MFPDLSQRMVTPEWMDDPALDERTHRAALKGLRRINRVSDSISIVWQAIAALARQYRDRPLSMLDVATGSGDVPIGVWKKARQTGLDIQIDACDISETALAIARKTAAQVSASIRFHQIDVLNDLFPISEGNTYDVVTCSLFLHHLANDQAVAMLRKIADAARHLVIVNDLERCRLGYAAAWLGTRLLTRSPVVHQDGPQSVAAGFTARELIELAAQVGMPGVKVKRCWPWRLRMT